MKIKTIGFALMATAALVGCQNQDGNNDAAGDPNDNNVEQTRFNDGDGNATTNDRNNRQDFDMNNDNNDNRGDNNDNGDKKYDVSKKAADKITDQVKGIDSSYVVTTENNAYVAVDFDTNNNDSNMNNTNNNMNNANNGNNKTDGTNGTNGMTGDNNDGDDKLTDDIKQKVSKIVKSVDGDIDNVYVSTNPDFLDSVKDFADQADNGKPIKGLFDQMGNMIERVFPQNK